MVERLTQETLNKDRLLVKWLCLDLGPFDVLEYSGFRKYFEDENYTLPSMKMFLGELIPKHYDKARTELKKLLDIVHYVAISIESWKLGVTSRIRGQSMWTATVHFVHQGKLLSHTLFTIQKKVTSAENMAVVLRKILLYEWRIFHKVVCFVTSHDDKENQLRHAVIDHLKIPHICCAASALNLDMHEIFNYLKFEEIKKRYQTYSYHSEISNIKKADPFSWHIPYTILKDIIENNPCNFNANELKEIRECIEILKPYEDFINKLSSEQYLTLSHTIPLTVGMKLKINKVSPITELGSKFKKKIEEAIEQNFGMKDNKPIADAVKMSLQIGEKATFMDPRFKRAGFMTEEQADSVQQDVIMELNECVNSYGQQNLGTSTPNRHSDEEGETVVDTGNLLLYLDKRVNYMTDNARFSVEQYVNLPYIHHSSNTLQFWDNFNGISKYDCELLKMSQKYLCIPSTAIPVESISGEFLYKKTISNSIHFNERRNLLDLERIDEVLFLHSYYFRNAES